MAVFDPLEVSRLQTAFDRSWRALGFAFADSASSESAEVRRFLASQIISLAKEGEKDPKVLSNAALASLPPYRAR
jgi:hypothetical protein